MKIGIVEITAIDLSVTGAVLVIGSLAFKFLSAFVVEMAKDGWQLTKKTNRWFLAGWAVQILLVTCFLLTNAIFDGDGPVSMTDVRVSAKFSILSAMIAILLPLIGIVKLLRQQADLRDVIHRLVSVVGTLAGLPEHKPDKRG